MSSHTRIETERNVANHYDAADPQARIYAGLRAAGLDSTALDADSLAPVDEFHIRGREATIELANLVELDADAHVLDVGCGIGGSARYLAKHYGCTVTGIDLTQTYCDLANQLSARTGLADRVVFRQASALELPFADGTFDVVWTEHAQMNIADKRAFYSEMARVVRPGGAVAFHDIFAGDGGEVRYPTPWASHADSSFLLPVAELRALLDDLGLQLDQWRDCTEVSTNWFRNVRDRIAAHGPPPIGVHLLMGDGAAAKIANASHGFDTGALATIQAVARKPS